MKGVLAHFLRSWLRLPEEPGSNPTTNCVYKRLFFQNGRVNNAISNQWFQMLSGFHLDSLSQLKRLKKQLATHSHRKITLYKRKWQVTDIIVATSIGTLFLHRMFREGKWVGMRF